MKLNNEQYNNMLLMISANLEIMKETSGFVPTLENIKPKIENIITFWELSVMKMIKRNYWKK